MPYPVSQTRLSRLGSLAQRLGFDRRPERRIRDAASRLSLPFRYLPLPSETIWWRDGPPLHRLPELPRGALSGPVQEDKEAAHAMLVRLVERELVAEPRLDLRRIDGLLGSHPISSRDTRLEDYADHCRKVRIISFRDFEKVLEGALPDAGPLPLRQASWRGERLFWAGEQAEMLACLVVYARRRELEVLRPALIERFRLSPEGVADLQQHFHALAMPFEAWSDPAFMALLLDSQLPYSRLKLFQSTQLPDFLLLPKQHLKADALGQGLRLAGAPELADSLSRLLD